VREIRMLRTTWRELETELGDGLRHRHEAKAAGKPLLPVPTATAPALDPTKRTFGGGLRAKREESQEREASLTCQLLNRMLDLGRPLSYPVS
jgi:hypothetical protein